MAAPEGWAPSQLKPEQPTATFDQFSRTILNEIARCLQLPFNVAALNSSSYNYSSGRMDYQVYFKHLRTLRADLERAVLDPLLAKWLDEAALVAGLLPDGLPPVATWEWSWTWDGSPDVDPVKEAEADAMRLESHTTTLADVCARAGKDWRAVLRQRAAELEAARELGLAPAPMPAAPSPPPAAAARSQAVTAEIVPEPVDIYDLTRPLTDDPMPDPDALEAAAGPLELAESYKAPNAARDEAIRGLAWREEYGRGGTAVGVARARDLANGRPLSESTVRRMAAFFSRHAGNRAATGWRPGEAGYPSAGRIAHSLWGGDSGRDWAARIVRKLDREEATA
jgi:hypothetical protein